MERVINCYKCKSYLGKIVDETVLEIGAARIYNYFRFSCACGRYYSFKPDDEFLSGLELSDEKKIQQEKILNGLKSGSKKIIKRL